MFDLYVDACTCALCSATSGPFCRHAMHLWARYRLPTAVQGRVHVGGRELRLLQLSTSDDYCSKQSGLDVDLETRCYFLLHFCDKVASPHNWALLAALCRGAPVRLNRLNPHDDSCLPGLTELLESLASRITCRDDNYRITCRTFEFDFSILRASRS